MRKTRREVIQRQDDEPQTVKRDSRPIRFKPPLIDYYAEKGLLVNIDGNRSIDDVFEDIVKILN